MYLNKCLNNKLLINQEIKRLDNFNKILNFCIKVSLEREMLTNSLLVLIMMRKNIYYLKVDRNRNSLSLNKDMILNKYRLVQSSLIKLNNL